MTPFPYTTVERDYQQLRLRYPRLHVIDDFTKLSCIWPDKVASQDVISYPLEAPVKFWVGDKKTEAKVRRRCCSVSICTFILVNQVN